MVPGKDIKRYYPDVQMNAKHLWESALIGSDNNDISVTGDILFVFKIWFDQHRQ